MDGERQSADEYTVMKQSDMTYERYKSNGEVNEGGSDSEEIGQEVDMMRSRELYVKKCLQNKIKDIIRNDSVTKRQIGILAFIVNPGYTKDDE